LILREHVFGGKMAAAWFWLEGRWGKQVWQTDKVEPTYLFGARIAWAPLSFANRHVVCS